MRVIGRRWYAAVPVLAAVLLFGPALVGSADPEYRASGSVVLLRHDPTVAPDPQGEEGLPGNPYANFNGSIVITAAVLESIGSGDALRQRVVDAGATADFTIEQEEDAPILVIEATASRRASAIDSVPVIVETLEAELSERQARFDVPAEDRIVMETVLLPERASVLETARNRALTVVIALGVAGVIAATVLAESFASGRARTRGVTATRAGVKTARYPHGAGATSDPTSALPPPRPLDPSVFEGPNRERATPADQRRR